MYPVSKNVEHFGKCRPIFIIFLSLLKSEMNCERSWNLKLQSILKSVADGGALPSRTFFREDEKERWPVYGPNGPLVQHGCTNRPHQAMDE